MEKALAFIGVNSIHSRLAYLLLLDGQITILKNIGFHIIDPTIYCHSS